MLANEVIALIALEALTEFVIREKIHQLSKHGAAFVQVPPLG